MIEGGGAAWKHAEGCQCQPCLRERRRVSVPFVQRVLLPGSVTLVAGLCLGSEPDPSLLLWETFQERSMSMPKSHSKASQVSSSKKTSSASAYRKRKSATPTRSRAGRAANQARKSGPGQWSVVDLGSLPSLGYWQLTELQYREMLQYLACQCQDCLMMRAALVEQAH